MTYREYEGLCENIVGEVLLLTPLLSVPGAILGKSILLDHTYYC